MCSFQVFKGAIELELQLRVTLDRSVSSQPFTETPSHPPWVYDENWTWVDVKVIGKPLTYKKKHIYFNSDLNLILQLCSHAGTSSLPLQLFDTVLRLTDWTSLRGQTVFSTALQWDMHHIEKLKIVTPRIIEQRVRNAVDAWHVQWEAAYDLFKPVGLRSSAGGKINLNVFVG